MTGTAPWLASAEALLNRNVRDSSSAAALARRLDGSCLRVEAGGSLTVCACFSGGRLSLLNGAAGTGAAGKGAAGNGDPIPDAIVSGSPAALLSLALATAVPGTPARLSQARLGSVQIRGDAEIARLYSEFFAAAKPDWEEELSRILGDLAARRISLLAGKAFNWSARLRRNLHENIAEYLQEESRDLVAATEVTGYLHAVDEVRDAVERVSARLQLLEVRCKDLS